ncbi:MAG TPA: glycosyltransferase family 4 protein [Acidobacteriota bacterium]|nr:glycosyltransferase family 4 protein [Acidobacteriota bacterium]
MSLFQIDSGKEWRGGQRQSFFLVRELQKKGYPCRFYVQPNSPLYKKAEQEGLPVFPLKVRSEADIIAVLKLARQMKKANCVLVHSHDAHAAAVSAMAASRAKIPLRFISRRVDFPLKNNYFSKIKYRRDVDMIIAISEGVKKVLVSCGIDKKKIKVVPSGIDYTPFENVSSKDYLHREFGFSKNDFLVGIVAHLADHKGHKYLIEAAGILKKKAPNIKLIIVGKGPLRMELDQKVKEVGVEDIVLFLGFREDVPQIMASLDLFVLSSYLEGLGTSILDAMASHLPVVATDVGGIPEVVTHEKTGLLVPPKNPAALARAILRIYNDRKLAYSYGENGYRVVHEKYSSRAMAKKVIKEYETIARRKNINLRPIKPFIKKKK